MHDFNNTYIIDDFDDFKHQLTTYPLRLLLRKVINMQKNTLWDKHVPFKMQVLPFVNKRNQQKTIGYKIVDLNDSRKILISFEMLSNADVTKPILVSTHFSRAMSDDKNSWGFYLYHLGYNRRKNVKWSRSLFTIDKQGNFTPEKINHNDYIDLGGKSFAGYAEIPLKNKQNGLGRKMITLPYQQCLHALTPSKKMPLNRMYAGTEQTSTIWSSIRSAQNTHSNDPTKHFLNKNNDGLIL